MPRRNKQGVPDEYICTVDILFVKDLDPLTSMRGYARGIDPKEIQAEAERWFHLKVKNVKDEDPEMKIDNYFRLRKRSELPHFPDLTGVEDIRASLRAHDEATGMRHFEAEMSKFTM